MSATDIAAITGLITAITALIAAISGVLNHRKITRAQKTASQIKTITTDSAAQVQQLINGKNGGTTDAGNHRS